MKSKEIKTNEEIIEKVLKDVIGRHKDWLQKNPTGYPLMQLSEVEKCMLEAIQEVLKMKEEEKMKEFNLSEKIREVIITENEIQRILSLPDDSPDKGIEFSLSGELVPLEKIEHDIKEFIKRLKETIAEGVKRNNVLPLDWCFDRIDTLAGEDLK